MMTLEERLKALGDVLDDHYGPVALHELGRPQEREDDDLTVVDLRGPGESPAPPPRKRRALVLSVAAAILVVAGVVAVADRDGGRGNGSGQRALELAEGSGETLVSQAYRSAA